MICSSYMLLQCRYQLQCT